MHFGVSFLNADGGADPIEIGRHAERLGFESVFVPDHTHIPVSRRSAYPMPPWEMPEEYCRMRDPFVTLAGIAAVTKTIKLGTGICLIIERDPIILAKTTATLDAMSKGRLVLGVGAGWNLEEMQNHGTNPDTRFTLMKERVEAIKTIWTHDQAEYHGKLVNFDPIFSWPKPTQRPHPPVIIGGGGPSVLKRVVAFGDGWFPGHQKNLDELGQRISELGSMAAAAGRPPPPVSIMLGLPQCFGKYLEIGAFRVVVGIPSDSVDEAVAALEKLAGQIAQFRDQRPA